MGLGKSPAKPHWYERNWFKAAELAAIIVGILGVVIGVGAIGYEVYQRESVDRPVADATLRELQITSRLRIAQILDDESMPLDPKIDAINTLFASGARTDRLDLSCVRVPLTEGSVCARILDGIDFRGPRSLVGLNLPELLLINARFDGMHCVACDFRNTAFQSSRFDGATLTSSDLSGGHLGLHVINDLKLIDVNLSGLVIGAVATDAVDLTGGWFHRGNPPLVIRDLDLQDQAEIAIARGAMECQEDFPSPLFDIPQLVGITGTNGACVRWGRF